MNILFANLHWSYEGEIKNENIQHLLFPTGMAIIAAEIQQYRNDELFVIDNKVSKINDRDVLTLISTKNIDCILISAFLGNYQYHYLKQFVKKIIENFPGCKVIVGGPLASTVPTVFLKSVNGNDEQVIMVIGEGEKTIINLLNSLEKGENLSKVEGICYKKKNNIIQTPSRARIQNLDEHPYPAYELFDIKKYIEYTKSTNRCWELCTSRGCYGRCVYCKRVFGNTITMRSALSIVREMEDFSMKYDINRFNFVDDNFLNSKKQVFAFYNALKKSPVEFKWRFQGRADRFTPTLAKKLVKVGLYDVSFGIESGSPIILKEMMKMLNIETAKQNLKSLPEELDTHASFIIGMPSESHETIRQTVQFIKSTQIKNVNAGILTIFPRTPLYEQVMVKGIIKDEDDYCNRLGPAYVYPYINLTSYSDDQLLQWRDSVSKALE